MMSDGTNDDRWSPADLIARAVSYVVSPVLIPLYTTVVVLQMVGADTGQAVAAFLFIGSAFVLIPLTDILWMVSRGMATSVELSDKRERREPLVLTIVSGLAGFIIYPYVTTSLELISVLSLAYVANLTVVLLITLFWKISVHAVAIAGMLAVTMYLVGPTFRLSIPLEALLIATLVVLVPVVMWARVRLEMHTVGQVAAGGALGFVGHWLGLYYGTLALF